MTNVWRTLSEIVATGTKAARASGCSWGQAEEAGMAARVLACHGLPGPEILATTLSTPRACSCTGSKTGPRCGIAAAAHFGDVADTLGQGERIDLGDVAGPGLVVAPALMAAKRLDRWYQVNWANTEVICAPNGCSVSNIENVSVASVSVQFIGQGGAVNAPSWNATEIEADKWEFLSKRAAETLVPETDASRARGAGPGSSDAD